MTEAAPPEATLLLAAGTSATAAIPGISAAGADPEARRWTPTADAEVLAAGAPVTAPAVPQSPTGCPTPAVVSRAVRELVDFDLVALDAGLAEPPGVDAVDVGAMPGGDVRDADPVPDAGSVLERARELGAAIDAEHVLLAETIPGGTTTAMGVLAALGERSAVSSSLPTNPIERKRAAVDAGLAASGLERGDLAGQPREAVRRMGDPVLATLAGVAMGVGAEARVTLAGGTQLAAAGALVRHAAVDRPLALATTRYVACDESASVRTLAADLGLDLRVTDPEFESAEAGLDRFAAGEAKEGVGMGGALALAVDRGVGPGAVADRAATVLDRCLVEAP